MTWPFKIRPVPRVDTQESKQALADALSRRARTRRVVVAVDRAITQNHFTSDLETIMEGHR